ncbi:allophanate hydrolase [Mycobacterium sp.]|uniref:allophanate hydrolase n=1 Tax=Mycobacterium sp. TaxID=1785 RepID=UPI002B88F6D2|nr:allophanate hydrolase [Mycobacterium sp.]HME49382.1 allophanate hydrolase [Mycobacterium sp.]
MTVWITRRDDDDVSAELAAAPSGPLAGVRLAVKDNVDVAGLPTTAACPEFAYLPQRDAAAVAALRAAGAVVVGKTNLDQFATGLVGTRSPYGVVPDSRRPEYISGGSSSGSAVAVALGEADIAVGTDTAGSGRVPAGLQGIAGIKPTVGVISTDGVVPACESYDCVTIFAAGLAAANRAMAVLAAGAPNRRWPADTRLAAPPQPVIAVPRELPELDQGWRSAFDAAVTALSEAGARIVPIGIGPFLDAAKLLYGGALVSERYAAVGGFIDAHPGAALDPTVRGIIAAARDIAAHELVRDRREVERLRRVAMVALEGADALMVPTSPMHPRISEVAADPVGVNARLGTYTNFCNLFDMCAVAVPAGTAGHAQFGVTVLGRAFDDAVVLDVAALIDGHAVAEVWPLGAASHAELVVFGAHLRGGPLEDQLTGLGARFAGELTTAPRYRMSVLDTTPAKPAITRCPDGVTGAALTGHRWLLSPAALGTFLAALPPPMQLGKVEFADGSWRTAFGCDGAAAAAGTDISGYGSWPAAVAAGAVAAGPGAVRG